MTLAKRSCLAVVTLMGALIADPAMAGGRDQRGRAKSPATGDEDRGDRAREASPFIVGTWKFVPNGNQAPSVDTEFRFINPTALTLTLEYAFFNLDGSFCGCDRDDFPPNKTTIYTMLAEQQLPPPLPGGPNVFSCTDTSGALKSIVFLSKGEEIFLGDASQVGFQTHAFGGIQETDTSLQGSVMTEAGMQRVPINDSTREEIRKIHEQCVTVNGPLSSN